ncbi:transcription elongation factor B polypeptide 3-like isoform X2 [Dermacentor albipictus]|uniref:transcription elongation factor B polypeptide 3-like isoform X2 n=1 Tax=Dermacentor albipictus TaxID=60249 RepID=UPI0031FBD794
MADWKERILHYGKRLEKNQSDEKVLETLRKLQKVPMTLTLLQETGIGRTVNHLKKSSGVIGELARAVIGAWKQVVSDSTAEYAEQQQQQQPAPAVPSKRHHDSKQDGPPPKAHRTSKLYSIEVETSSPIENVPAHSRHKQNGDSHQYSKHHHDHHHQNSSRHHHREERAATPPPPKVEPPPKKSPEEKVDKKQMKKLLKKAGHSEGGLDGSIASFEACLGLNDTVTLPKPKKKSQPISPNKKQQPSRVEPVKDAIKQHSSRGTEHSSRGAEHSSRGTEHSSGGAEHSSKGAKSSRSKNGESGGSGGHSSSSSSRSSKHTHKKEQLMPEALRKPDLAPLDRDEVSSMLPEIQPVYKPLPHRLFDEPPSKPPKKSLTNEEAIIFTSSRKDRTQVYSGRRNCFLPEVPTLHEACIKVLIENVEGMAYTGGVPYDILKPVLERCTPKQLYTLEDYNPYLLDDTDELWQAHCTREFKSSTPDAGETWRELYLKKYDEREEKFKSLTATISASMAKATPVRQTKLAYVDTVAKPPRNVARQQAKHGTGVQIAVPVRPSDRLSSRPTSSPSISASISTSISASVSRPPSTAVPKKPKHAPLMQKTLKFMKQRFKR